MGSQRESRLSLTGQWRDHGVVLPALDEPERTIAVLHRATGTNVVHVGSERYLWGYLAAIHETFRTARDKPIARASPRPQLSQRGIEPVQVRVAVIWWTPPGTAPPRPPACGSTPPPRGLRPVPGCVPAPPALGATPPATPAAAPAVPGRHLGEVADRGSQRREWSAGTSTSTIRRSSGSSIHISTSPPGWVEDSRMTGTPVAVNRWRPAPCCQRAWLGVASRARSLRTGSGVRRPAIRRGASTRPAPTRRAGFTHGHAPRPKDHPGRVRRDAKPGPN